MPSTIPKKYFDTMVKIRPCFPKYFHATEPQVPTTKVSNMTPIFDSF